MTPRQIARIVSGVAVVTVLNACITVRPPTFLRPAAERDWPATLSAAETRVSEGRYGLADSVLASFSAKYAGSAQAFEAAYWRALFSMDPKNSRASIPTAVTYLDAYLTGLHPRQHRQEAFALRAIAAQIDENRNALALAQTKDAASTQPGIRVDVPKPATDPATAVSDAEIKRLKDELAKANAELERIRKRLLQPPR